MVIIDNIINCHNKVIKISALAGTGKTTTAKHLLNQYQPDIHMLVLVFNNDNNEE